MQRQNESLMKYLKNTAKNNSKLYCMYTLKVSTVDSYTITF